MASKSMTKTEVVSRLAEKCRLSKKQMSDVLEEIVHLAIDETRNRGAFVIPGIGKLFTEERKGRDGRNPRTQERIWIPDKTVVKFKVFEVCQNAVVPNENSPDTR